MKGHEKVIELLNSILTLELSAVNQYWIHARMCESWGYLRLWEKLRAESLGEMKHADALIARILHLEGIPNLQRYGKITIGETVLEQLKLDVEVERTSIRVLNEAISTCRTLDDNGTCVLLETLLQDSEGHVNWIEMQIEQIERLGEANYLTQQIRP
ncbi:MAG: bacterioferritin [Deltaproteobacteria bacterium]|nr:bacterioferritin [Deltaproteobacteria bacterium]